MLASHWTWQGKLFRPKRLCWCLTGHDRGNCSALIVISYTGVMLDKQTPALHQPLPHPLPVLNFLLNHYMSSYLTVICKAHWAHVLVWNTFEKQFIIIVTIHKTFHSWNTARSPSLPPLLLASQIFLLYLYKSNFSNQWMQDTNALTYIAFFYVLYKPKQYKYSLQRHLSPLSHSKKQNLLGCFLASYLTLKLYRWFLFAS